MCVYIPAAGGEMTEQSKPKADKLRGTKMVRCPANVHALLLELRQLMAEQGHTGYWLNKAGKVVHGSVADAPLHLVVQWALTTAIEILHPAREQFAAAHVARENYLASFEEEPGDVEE